MTGDNHEICIKTMSGDDEFYEYVNNRACKLLSRVQGIDEGSGKKIVEILLTTELQMSVV